MMGQEIKSFVPSWFAISSISVSEKFPSELDRSQKMNRIPFFVVSEIVNVLAMGSLILMLVPVDFVPFTGAGETVTIGWRSMFCKTPSANINATHAQLCQLWKLPETVALSKRMVDVGKCLMAVGRNPATYDRRECFCIGGCWSLMLIAIAAFMVIETNVDNGKRKRILSGRCRAPYSRKEFECHRRVQVIRVVAFLVWGVIFINSFEDGFTFTKYGNVVSSDYYNDMPLPRSLALWFFIVAVIGQSCSVMVFDVVGIAEMKKESTGL